MSDIILPTEEKKDPKTITPGELNAMSNCIMAVLCHPETKEMQIVINGGNEFILSTAIRKLNRALDGYLDQIAQMVYERKQASAIQTVSKVVLDRLNGNA